MAEVTWTKNNFRSLFSLHSESENKTPNSSPNIDRFGDFLNSFRPTANFPATVQWNKFGNRSLFGKVIDKSLVSCFLTHDMYPRPINLYNCTYRYCCTIDTLPHHSRPSVSGRCSKNVEQSTTGSDVIPKWTLSTFVSYLFSLSTPWFVTVKWLKCFALKIFNHHNNGRNKQTTKGTRKRCTGQVLPSAKYRPTRLVVDAALRPVGKTRHGGHKIANISLNCQWI